MDDVDDGEEEWGEVCAEVATLAGGVNGTLGAYADGSGTNAGFDGPTGVAVDVSGNVFVADQNNQCIRQVTMVGGMWISPFSPLF